MTGKEKIEYFFDPTLTLPDLPTTETPFKGVVPTSLVVQTPAKANGSTQTSVNDILYGSRHLFLPCTVVKTLDSSESDDTAITTGQMDVHETPVLVKTSDGALYKIRDKTRLTRLSAPEDYIGVDDVLHLSHVTEASLLHALRIRYKRDCIYTFAGPILMSVNPYKTIDDGSMYGEKNMMIYRNNRSDGRISWDAAHAVGEGLPPHLFYVADRAYSALMSSHDDDVMH